MVFLSALGMDPARIAQVTFTSADRVRDVIHNFNAVGFRRPLPALSRRAAVDVHAGPPATASSWASMRFVQLA
jgi:hypothetical protein